jgi:tetratricopeptide (TPR) repeat protein
MSAQVSNSVEIIGLAELKVLTNELTSLLKASLPYSNIELSALYNVGVHFYEQRNWSDAARVFGMVNMLSPFNPLFLIAQGKCLKSSGAYDDAFEIFYLAWSLNKFQPEPALHAAECLMLVEQKARAIELIHELLASSVASEANSDNVKKAKAWLALLTCEELNA